MVVGRGYAILFRCRLGCRHEQLHLQLDPIEEYALFSYESGEIARSA